MASLTEGGYAGLENGCRVSLWKLAPVTVHGGYQLRWERWVYGADGHDVEWEYCRSDRTVYATVDAAQEALARICNSA